MQKAEAHVYFLNTIGMGDWFWGTTLNDVRYCVEGWAAYDGGSLPQEQLPATVVLHFPACRGGDVVEGYGIYNYLRGLAAKGVKIVAQVEGLCASIAVLIALAADEVLMADAALWMVHKPSSSGAGNADELRAEADILDKIQAQIVSRYVARCGGKLDAATANDLINKESWLNADECLAYGFITGKLHDEPLVAPTGADAVLNYFPTKKPANAMATMTAQEEKDFFQKIGNFLRDEFGLKPKNEGEAETAPPVTNAATSADVDGGEPMYFDGTDLAQGTAVYSDEAMTTAYEDGDYTLSDGRAATVASGSISSLTDAESEDNAENSAEALAAANAELDRLKAENALLNRKVTGLQNKVRQQVPGSGGNPNTPGAAQNHAPRNTASAPGVRDAERSLILPRK